MADLTIIIPSRNEIFLANTIEDILKNMRGDTEIIAIADGEWPDPPIPEHPKVSLIYHNTSIGQRAATNEGARLSRAKFIMKVDAHCSFDEGFDIKMMADCEYDWTAVPRMYNLHAFDWKCKICGERTYQGPNPVKCNKCKKANKNDFEMVLVWKPRWSRKSDFMRFDSNLKFGYWGSMVDRPEYNIDISDQMCCVGACWMMHRERYWDIDGMDESHGSWGQMGVELACKSWLSGGRQIVNKKTWFAHMFRTQPGFGFPYPNSGVEKARKYSRELWFNNKWPKAKHPLSWMIRKFWPIPEWKEIPPDPMTVEEEKKLTKGLIYYTDNRADPQIRDAVCNNLNAISNGNEIISVSLAPINFGKNIVVSLQRGILTMFKQILAGLEASTADIAFLVEHDIIYHPSHFDFIPPHKDVYYYNEHTYKIDYAIGHSVFYYTKQTSGLCAFRKLLVEHYRKRIAKCEQNARDIAATGQPVKNEGFSRHMGFEPGCHSYPRGVDNFRVERWMSPYPNLDIRHDKNLTLTRWDTSLFRDKNACQGWRLLTPTEKILGWNSGEEIVNCIKKGETLCRSQS